MSCCECGYRKNSLDKCHPYFPLFNYPKFCCYNRSCACPYASVCTYHPLSYRGPSGCNLGCAGKCCSSPCCGCKCDCGCGCGCGCGC